MIVHPVILCGGSGTRLWPVSRKAYPKQFAPLISDQSLYQMTLARFAAEGFAAPW
jgi:mannose-1-phosphate guanylyltransferase/mannose-6-phosphate isomerase